MRSLSGVRPSSGHHTLDVDCIIVEQLVEAVSGAPKSSVLHFCTSDEDFLVGKKRRTLHQDVTGAFTLDLQFDSGLPALLEALNKPVSAEKAAEYDDMAKFVTQSRLAQALADVARVTSISLDPSVQVLATQVRNAIAHMPTIDPKTLEAAKQLSLSSKEMQRIATMFSQFGEDLLGKLR